ncbi:hypothetical protein ES288_A09G060100v1 [Gossypium darwinii]|uniref:Uncharacterized protein n=1 Tax=Gossypium darwinii TaxID=34276 RepID=A0A5D2F6N5_GOSDA|nr:hypothetical protein ES288_A09G060100v1 [Gossypium darwinii]
MTGLIDIPISEWKTRWMQDMKDILVCIAKYNWWPTPTLLSDMFERFPPPSKEGVGDDDEDDKEEETPIATPDYEQISHPDRSSTKGVVIHDLSQHSSAQTSGMRATKTLVRHDRGKAQMIKELESESD